MATADTHTSHVESSRERWLRERNERVKAAIKQGQEKFDAIFIGIYAAAGPGGAGGGDHEAYISNSDGSCFIWYGPEKNYVYQNDPEELQRKVMPEAGIYRVGGNRETLAGQAIRTINLEEVLQHTHAGEGLFTPTAEYLLGHNVYEQRSPLSVSSQKTSDRRNHSGTSKRVR